MPISLIYVGFIFPLLMLPFFILNIYHPNNFIRRLSKILITLSLIVAIIVVPLYGLHQLGIKSLLIPIVPILSRGVTWGLEKTNVFKVNLIVIVDKLLKLSFISVGLVMLGTAYNQPLKPVVFTIIVIAFILFVDIGKYILMGYLFGIVLAVFLISQSTDAMFTVVFIYIVVMLFLRFFDKVYSFSEKVRNSLESSAMIIILLISYPLIINGGLKLNFEDLFVQLAVFIGLLSIYLCTTYLIGRVKFSISFQHYIPSGTSFLLVFLILKLIENFNIANRFGIVFYLLIFIFLFLTLFRVFSPLAKDFHFSSFINSTNILEGLQFYFGKKFGQNLFNFLCGSSPELIKPILAYLMLVVHFIGLIIIYLQIIPEGGKVELLKNDFMFYTLMSVGSILSFVTSISKTIELQKINEGMTTDEAMKSSASITLNYFLTLVPFILIFFKESEGVGLFGVVFAIIYIFLIIVNTSFALFRDFLKPEYSKFALTRSYLSMAILILPHIALIGAFLYYFDVNNTLNSLKQIIGIFVLLSFLSIIIAQVISYDNILGSKKLKKLSFPILVILIIMIKPITMMNAYIFLLIGFKWDIAIKLTFYFEVSFFMDMIALLVIVLVPSSNDNYKGKLSDILHSWKSQFYEKN